MNPKKELLWGLWAIIIIIIIIITSIIIIIIVEVPTG